MSIITIMIRLRRLVEQFCWLRVIAVRSSSAPFAMASSSFAAKSPRIVCSSRSTRRRSRAFVVSSPAFSAASPAGCALRSLDNTITIVDFSYCAAQNVLSFLSTILNLFSKYLVIYYPNCFTIRGLVPNVHNAKMSAKNPRLSTLNRLEC